MSEVKQLSQAAQQVLQDPILLRQLCDRVYELLQEDVRNQRDREGYTPRRLR